MLLRVSTMIGTIDIWQISRQVSPRGTSGIIASSTTRRSLAQRFLRYLMTSAGSPSGVLLQRLVVLDQTSRGKVIIDHVDFF